MGQPRLLRAESCVLEATQQLRVRAGLRTAQMYIFAYPQTMFETMKRKLQIYKETEQEPTTIHQTTAGWPSQVRQAADIYLYIYIYVYIYIYNDMFGKI